MERTDIVIIGAGVIGLAIAERLSRTGKEVILIDRHEGFGKETSSRNSEVIHGGLYYNENMLKTQLCIRGNPLLYELCAEHGIPHQKTGKLVVSTTKEEMPLVEELKKQAETNGSPGIEIITQARIQELEPLVFGLNGVYSPSSGIVDSHSLMAYLESAAESNGVTIAYGCEVTGASKAEPGYRVEMVDTDGEGMQISCEILVNSGGLWADGITEMLGMDADTLGYRIHPCKGEYFKVSDQYRGKISHLVYPVPTPVYLGAHVDLALDGTFKVGPSAFYVDDIEYSVDAANGDDFYEKTVRFLPFVTQEDFTPDMSGIRPKLYREGEAFRDFVIREESDHGLPNFINLVGMESPGLTSCIAIAEYVEKLL